MFAAPPRRRLPVSFVAAFGIACALTAPLQAQNDTLGHQDTPLIPGTKWHVHDGLRPQPTIVTPPVTDSKPVPAPADAIVLFDGKDLSNWRTGDGKPATWKLESGAVVSNGTGDLFTKKEFGDCQIHVEWSAPEKVVGNGQGRGNSGVWLMGRYEIQVLDSYQNPTYPDGQAGAVYGQHPPLVNVSRKPGEWQTYDIFFTAPRFEGDTLKEPPYVTVVHNGVLVQNHTAIIGDTVHAALAKYNGFSATGPLKLQDHQNPVRFRNIWIRELKSDMVN